MLERLQDFDPSEELDARICVYCGEIGIGGWSCYCMRDD